MQGVWLLCQLRLLAVVLGAGSTVDSVIGLVYYNKLAKATGVASLS